MDPARMIETAPHPHPHPDPDRFFDLRTPGAQEWWYFDAIGDDRRDALVVIFYAALPFDPSYGVAALRHLRSPDRFPAPHPLDHCAVGISWYRLDGATVPRKGRGNPGPLAQAYALNAYRRGAFRHDAEPFRVAVAGNELTREAGGYRLRVETPDVSPGRTVLADLRFRPSEGSRPLEVDLGGDGSPHHWILAAADCRVEGNLAIDGPGGGSVGFRGRGYHDHNAGAEELSTAMRRWEWGRVHRGETTEVYYVADPRADAGTESGPRRALWITCRDGRPDRVIDRFEIRGQEPRRSALGPAYERSLLLREGGDGSRLLRRTRLDLDRGPFYSRWLSDFRDPRDDEDLGLPGISEVLDTRWLNHPLFNWMIPYRLKRPES